MAYPNAIDSVKQQPHLLSDVELCTPAEMPCPPHEDQRLGYSSLDNASGVDRTHDNSVDLKGRPVVKSRTGGCKAASFIIGVELSERLAYYGIQSNLFVYLTTVLREGVPQAIKNTTNWTGVTLVVPVVGGFLADAYWGRYWTITTVSVVYVVGLLLLTLSVSIRPLKPTPCSAAAAAACPKASSAQIGFFYFSLYLISLGTGGIKPCLEAFGADQFDDEDAAERKQKSSFFNWWYFALCFGGLFAVTVLIYVEEKVSWGLGFGIPTVVMVVGCAVYFAGTPRYRHQLPGGSPLTQIAQVLVASLRNRNAKVPTDASSLHEVYRDPSIPAARRQLLHTEKLTFLDKAAVKVISDVGGGQLEASGQPSAWNLCTVTQVEEVKQVVKILPVWLTTFAYGVVFSQSFTVFTSQVKSMDTSIGTFQIPAASFQAFMTITVLLLLPVYDRVLVPAAKKLTGNERGISMLQRIGVGLFFSFLCMVAAALTEARRLRVAARTGVLDKPKVILPMSAFWMLPQYILLGVADVFTLVGEQEFFYDQVPDSMRSLGMALYLSANGMGSFISTLLVTIVSAVSGSTPWILTNVNRSRVDLFYWLLAVISVLNLLAFVLVAFFYDYKRIRSPLVIQDQPYSIDNCNSNHKGLSHKDSLQRYHHRPSNASSASSH